MALSHFDLQNAKPRDKPYKVSDGQGLHVVINPNGSVLWRLKYRFLGTERLLSLGRYPQISIHDARVKRDQALKFLSEGRDPSVEKKLSRIAAETAARTTFKLVAEDLIAASKANGAAQTTIDKNTWLLLDLASPIANRAIADITPAELLDLLKRVERSGRRETARRLRGVMGSVFRHAIVTLRANSDPTAALKGALLRPIVTPRAAIVEERALGQLMNSLDVYDGWSTLKAAMLFTALTCARPGEVRHAVRSEINFDRALWRIPAERMKMRQPHDVPLSRQAMDVLREIWPVSEGDGLIFPSIRSNQRPLSENAMNSALRRMGYGPEEMTAHGFRSSGSTILNEHGFNPDVIEAMLAHQDENAIRRAYNRSTYLKERVDLMQKWADMLDAFRLLKPVGASTLSPSPTKKTRPAKKK